MVFSAAWTFFGDALIERSAVPATVRLGGMD